ncbi:hypothetical protein GCM10023332_11330 [Luteimonas vadosa]|uniref:Uncharacterized protein n=1 Tax=Luteimonas vadosa TaxID=1165507 RepID=A0ABP9E0X8_9GAMM
MSKSVVPALLALATFSGYSLVSGAPYLEAMLPGGLPLGNALAAVALCAIAGAAFSLSARGTMLRAVSGVSLLLTATWLPLSAGLAGNLALNFGNGRGSAWVGWTLLVAALAVGTLAWALVAALLRRARRARAG